MEGFSNVLDAHCDDLRTATSSNALGALPDSKTTNVSSNAFGALAAGRASSAEPSVAVAPDDTGGRSASVEPSFAGSRRDAPRTAHEEATQRDISLAQNYAREIVATLSRPR